MMWIHQVDPEKKASITKPAQPGTGLIDHNVRVGVTTQLVEREILASRSPLTIPEIELVVCG
jgi:hypothetical protein